MTSTKLTPSDLDNMLTYRLNKKGVRKFRHDSMKKAQRIFDIIKPFYNPKECPSRLLRDLFNNPEIWLTNGKCTPILHSITGIWVDLKKMGKAVLRSKSRATIWILILLGRATGFWTSSPMLYLNSGYQITFTLSSVKACQKSILTLFAIHRFRRSEMGIFGVLHHNTIQHIAALVWTSRYEFVWMRNPLISNPTIYNARLVKCSTSHTFVYIDNP